MKEAVYHQTGKTLLAFFAGVAMAVGAIVLAAWYFRVLDWLTSR